MDNPHRKPLSPLVVPDRLNQPIPSVHHDLGPSVVKKTPTSVAARARPAPTPSPIPGKSPNSRTSKISEKVEKSVATLNASASKENTPSRQNAALENLGECKCGETYRPEEPQSRDKREAHIATTDKGVSPARVWSVSDLYAENQSLRVQISRMSTELEELKNQSAFQREKLLYRISQHQTAEQKLTERLQKLESSLICQNLLYRCSMNTIEDLEKSVRAQESKTDKIEQDKRLQAWIDANGDQEKPPDEGVIELELEL